MSKRDKKLAQMRNNPRDWRIDDVLSVARDYGLIIRRPGGSHVIVSFSGGQELSIPAHRPIKPVYIKQFVALLDAMEE